MIYDDEYPCKHHSTYIRVGCDWHAMDWFPLVVVSWALLLPLLLQMIHAEEIPHLV